VSYLGNYFLYQYLLEKDKLENDKKIQEMAGKYYYSKDKGIYKCVCCGNELFKSDTKIDSGTGWPSFYAPLNQGSVEYHTDNSFRMKS